MLAVVVFGLIQSLVIMPGRIPSGSMEQTLSAGQIIAIDRLTPRWDPVKPGEVVVFRADEAWLGHAKATVDGPVPAIRWLAGKLGYGQGLEHLLVKRIVAEEGQTVSCCDVQGRVQVDGQPLDEPYIYEDLPFTPGVLDCETGSQRCFAPVIVPAGKLFMLGDHRSNSADSIIACRGSTAASCARFVSRDDIWGRVIGVKRG